MNLHDTLNLSKSQLIGDITPAYRQAHGISVAEAQVQLDSYDIAVLRRMWERQVQAGYIVPPHMPTEPAPATAQQAREKLQREYLEQEKQQLLRQQQQGLFQIVKDSIFRVGIILPGKALIKNAANRRLIDWDSLETPEQVKDFVLWLKNSPHILRVLAWEESNRFPTSPKPGSKQQLADDRYNAEQARIQRDKDWTSFVKFCYESEFLIAPNEANFEALQRAYGPGFPDDMSFMGITTLGDGNPYCLDGDGRLHELIPATPEEKEQGRVAYLKAIAKDDVELHRVARAGTHKPSEQTPVTKLRIDLAADTHPSLPADITPDVIRQWSAEEMKQAMKRYGDVQITARFNGLDKSTSPAVLHKDLVDLAAQYERDTQAGYTTPLPAEVTPEFIRSLNAFEMKKFMHRYGAARITARLNKIYDVRNERGEVYRIE